MIEPGVYQHIEGHLYRVVLTATNAKRRAPMVVYHPMEDYSTYLLAPLSAFEKNVQWPDGTRSPMFKRASEHDSGLDKARQDILTGKLMSASTSQVEALPDEVDHILACMGYEQAFVTDDSIFDDFPVAESDLPELSEAIGIPVAMSMKIIDAALLLRYQYRVKDEPKS